MSSTQAVTDFRRNRKKLLVEYCGGKCRLCGYDKSLRALQFHHIEEETKEYGISANGTCHNIDKDIKEVKKTILLCANCHAEVHDGLYSKEELFKKQFFDEKIITEYKQQKTAKITYCKNCGKIISTTANYCTDCNNIKRRIVERPSREILKQKIRNFPFTTIAKEYNVTDNAIRKWCKSMNLPSKKSDINNYSDEEWK
jgi:hypothetical protein